MPMRGESEESNPFGAPRSGDQPPTIAPESLKRRPKLAPARAVFLGHVTINGPVTLIMFVLPAVTFGALRVLSPELLSGPAGIGGLIVVMGSFIVGFALSWLYWSAAIPRWRDWVADHDCDLKAVQTLAAEQKLVWPKGSFFERTEFRRRDGRRGAD